MKTQNSRHHWRFRASQLVLCMILVAAASAGKTSPARAAGILTHAEVIERAIKLVDEQAYPDLVVLLKDYQGVVNYGSMFPDWPFTVPGSDLTETAHDTCGQPYCSRYAFRDALTASLIPAFRNLQTEEDRKAIAFLLGLIAHQETDNPWHFSQSGSPLAFESMISLQNFKRGTALEFLTELFIARHLLGFENKPEFWYPAEAALAAYKEVSRGDVTADDLKVGKDRQSLQYYAEIYAGWFVLPGSSWLAELPFIVVLEIYPSGGLGDAAQHTAEAWQQTWDWLSNH